MFKKIHCQKINKLFILGIYLLFPLFFSGCKLSLSEDNPAVKKSTDLINAQRINQQALNNPVPLVPGQKQMKEKTEAATEEVNPPQPKETATTPPSDTPDENDSTSRQAEWRELSKQYQGAILKTNFGEIKVDFFPDQSPLAVGNFIQLSQKNFYDQTKFHRVIKDFMVQGGDPNSKDSDWSDDGKGGPGYKFPDETGTKKLVRGTLAMANSGPNTNGSQFFIVTAEATPWLDGKHTVFGKLSNEKSWNVVKKIENVKTNEKDHPTEDVIIESIELLKEETKEENKEENKN